MRKQKSCKLLYFLLAGWCLLFLRFESDVTFNRQ